MREAERHRYGLAATADLGRPGCDPNSPVPSHPRSVTLPYSEVHVIDRPSGLHGILHAPGILAGFSWSHAHHWYVRYNSWQGYYLQMTRIPLSASFELLVISGVHTLVM